jgi:hypothetical protein
MGGVIEIQPPASKWKVKSKMNRIRIQYTIIHRTSTTADKRHNRIDIRSSVEISQRRLASTKDTGMVSTESHVDVRLGRAWTYCRNRGGS